MRRSLYEQPGALARTWRTSILPLLADQEPGNATERFTLAEILAELGLDEASVLRPEASAHATAFGEGVDGTT
jgi:5-methylcytosine-specific restriction protein B